ncbi:hypothetical protein P4V43_09230 [Brevibacillus fortis]|uniref:Uncharacterized protein n=1 Tax=Brevibacillus fortis TaxID=2126352 RepID=A0A2P7UEN8_9BACL|nr:hypothetical protein [Brevibacillus fortis]MED1781996.1 hypothetical protein [Brevibacillus fortis]PSJ85447.1 hypothetical protein C7R93_29885 [Brevibacillus fortis]PSJ93495.1 hypothetical protein C7R93_18425 [Brevibacillus fortis]
MIRDYSIVGADGILDGLFQTNSVTEYLAATLQLKLNGYKGTVQEVTAEEYTQLLDSTKANFH